MKTIFKTLIVLTLLILISSCSSLSSLPGIGSDADTESTPKAQANDSGNEDEDYEEETDLFDVACQMEGLEVVVKYDHRWIWSPDGTENSGSYIGTAKGENIFLLDNDGYGNFDSDIRTVFYSQEGTIEGNPGKCDAKGKGMAEATLYGTCVNGVIGLEWIEIDSGEQEATMTCDGKETPFVTYYPLQSVFTFELPDDGLGYRQSNDTAIPLFRSVSMEWTIIVTQFNYEE